MCMQKYLQLILILFLLSNNFSLLLFKEKLYKIINLPVFRLTFFLNKKILSK